MDTVTWIVLIVCAVIIMALGGGLLYMQRRKTSGLRDSFGSEYDRAVRDAGGRTKGERELEERRRRVERLHITPLTQQDAQRYKDSWRDVQARFVDEPMKAVQQSDRLIGEVMKARGYPVADFEQRAADVSVDHPRVVTNYRAAHAIAERNTNGNANGNGNATEDLRQAMIHYRELFNDLLTDRPASDVPKARRAG
jgi:hypothetical protein